MGWWPSSTLWWLCVHRVLLLSSTPGIGMGIVNVNGAEGDSVSGLHDERCLLVMAVIADAAIHVRSRD